MDPRDGPNFHYSNIYDNLKVCLAFSMSVKANTAQYTTDL